MLQVLYIVGTVVGLAAFIVAYYFFDKAQDNPEENRRRMQITAVISYVGLAVFALGGSGLVQPYFLDISEAWGPILLMIVEIVVFIGGAYFILRPAFSHREEKKEEETTKITPGGTQTTHTADPDKKKRRKNNSYKRQGSAKRRMTRR